MQKCFFRWTKLTFYCCQTHPHPLLDKSKTRLLLWNASFSFSLFYYCRSENVVVGVIWQVYYLTSKERRMGKEGGKKECLGNPVKYLFYQIKLQNISCASTICNFIWKNKYFKGFIEHSFLNSFLSLSSSTCLSSNRHWACSINSAIFLFLCCCCCCCFYHSLCFSDDLLSAVLLLLFTFSLFC